MVVMDENGHLVSTISEGELHNFAACINLKRDWYQNNKKHPHYDLTTSRAREKARNSGAKLVSSRKLIQIAWWAKDYQPFPEKELKND